MSKRAPIATREYLKQVPLPSHASSYTTITHETVIANALEQLKLKGFTVESERYRTNNNGEVAVGIYHLNYQNDPELGMMFAWANSYDKSMRFKCAVGGFVRVSESSIISGDFSWGRKHTGTADSEMVSQVANQILNGKIYYDAILEIREEMKNQLVTKTQVSEFLGRAFFMKNLFTKEQIGVVYDEILKPSFNYNADPDSLWSYYNHMLIALQKSHPRTWMEEQRDLHKFICSEFNVVTKAVVLQAAPVLTVTTTAHPGDEPVVIQATLDNGPVNIYSEQEPEKPVEKMNMEEFAETKENKVQEPVPTLEKIEEEPVIIPPNHTMGVPNEPVVEEEGISEAEQKLIDERIANLGKITIKVPNLNLPD